MLFGSTPIWCPSIYKIHQFEVFYKYILKNEVIFIEFSRNLKQIRKSKGYSQEEFANIVEIHPKTYRNYEQGIREPDLATLERIKIALECSYDDLLK